MLQLWHLQGYPALGVFWPFGGFAALGGSRALLFACAFADVLPFANEPRVYQHRAPLQNPVPTSSAEKVELMSIENLKINGAHPPLEFAVVVYRRCRFA